MAHPATPSKPATGCVRPAVQGCPSDGRDEPSHPQVRSGQSGPALKCTYATYVTYHMYIIFKRPLYILYIYILIILLIAGHSEFLELWDLQKRFPHTKNNTGGVLLSSGFDLIQTLVYLDIDQTFREASIHGASRKGQ